MLKDHFYTHPGVKNQIVQIEIALQENRISSYQAAQLLFNLYFAKD
jgi:hypothetical protein